LRFYDIVVVFNLIGGVKKNADKGLYSRKKTELIQVVNAAVFAIPKVLKRSASKAFFKLVWESVSMCQKIIKYFCFIP
jgi:hypothetical protein